MGFLDVDQLISLCNSTNWTTYKIWQAVKAGDLTYKPATFVRQDTGLRDALKIMISKNSKFAVVKKGNREVGMIGEQRLKEMLNRQSVDNTEESKDASFLENVQRKFQNWRGSKGVEDS